MLLVDMVQVLLLRRGLCMLLVIKRSSSSLDVGVVAMVCILMSYSTSVDF